MTIEDNCEWCGQSVEYLWTKQGSKTCKAVVVNDTWTSCSEETPPEDTPVFLLDRDHAWIGTYTYEKCIEEWAYTSATHPPSLGRNDKQWFCKEEYDDDYRPTHWCPLPDPYTINNP